MIDTTFVIRLWRERQRSAEYQFVARNPDDSASMPWVVSLLHYAALARSKQTVGANDLWIAASAIEHDLPLLTRNASEFRRVPGLKVVDYAGPA